MPNSGALRPSHELCTYNDINNPDSYGCGSKLAGTGNQEPQGFFNVLVEQDYLPDVLATEMNLAQIPPHIEALKAQAVASRTVASWKTYWSRWTVETVNGYEINTINNSTQYQVFIPGAYDPSSATQADVGTAVSATHGQYLSGGDGHTIDAEFGADMEVQTSTEHPDVPTSGFVPKTYLSGVEDPISKSCIVNVSGSHDYGMSQRGAIRWAKGQTCPDGTVADWPASGTISPIKWDYKQILAHYYTGVDFMNDNTGGKVAPNDRWNLLKHNVPTQMKSGISQSVEIWLQNTSTTAWNDARLVYQWVGTNEGGEVGLPSMLPGTDQKIPVTLMPPSADGTYTLRLDVKLGASGAWFSSAGWSDAQIKGITVTGGSTPTPTFPLLACTTILTGMECTQIDNYTVAISNMRSISYASSGAPITASGEIIAPLNTPVYLKLAGKFGYDNNVNWVAGRWSSPFHKLMGIRVDGVNYNPDSYVYLTNPPAFPANPYVFTRTTGMYNTETVIQKTTSGNLKVEAIASCIVACNYQQFNSAGLSFQLSLLPPASTHTPTPTNNNITSTSIPPGFTPSVPTATFTPAPTFTPIPTATLLPTAAPTPKPCWCPIRFLAGLLCGTRASTTNNVVMAAFRTANTLQEAAFDIQVFYRVEEQILSSTSEGQHYIDKYYAHGTEISGLLQNDSALTNEAIATLQLWQPNLQALVDGNGGATIITAEQVQAIQTFLDHLSESGSPALQQTITDERANRPLEATVGMTMSEAWDYLNGYQLTWLPPLNTKNPYAAQQGRVIPVEFTLTDQNDNFVEDRSVTLRVLDANGLVVLSSVGISENPKQGISVQAEKYHYNLDTSSLQKGDYALQVLYNSLTPQTPSSWQVTVTSKK